MDDDETKNYTSVKRIADIMVMAIYVSKRKKMFLEGEETNVNRSMGRSTLMVSVMGGTLYYDTRHTLFVW